MAEAQTAPQQPVIDVSRAELPLSCPNPDRGVYDLHPRVYLPIEKRGEVTCPYCGARYRLRDR